MAWLAAALLAVYLYSASFQVGQMMGTVEVVAEPVAPLETARLTSVDVRVGQIVKAGDVVAVMDASQLAANMAVDDAKTAEAEGTISGYQQNILKMVQETESMILDAEAAIETEKIKQERDTAELAELKKEQARLDGLLAKRLIDESMASALRPTIAMLEHSLAASPGLIKVQERKLDQAKKQREETKTWLRLDAQKDVGAAIRDKMKARAAIFESRKNLDNLRMEHLKLRATRDGVVSLILHKPGDVVSAGDPVVRLVQSQSSYVVGFLPEVQLANLTVGQKTWVIRSTGVGSRCGGVVESIGPEVQALPGRAAPIRGQPLRGRRIMVKLEGAYDLTPGETVQISSAEPVWTNFGLQIRRFLGR